jgi:thioredoxin reductase
VEDIDVLVCGGGPAGLAAAVWLGRYRRRTVVVDNSKQRNLPAVSSHGYLTRDGCSPGEFIDTARAEADAYDTVELVTGDIKNLTRDGVSFTARVGPRELRARRVLFATGVEDVHPKIPGFGEMYGRSIFHCSCCDGFESRGMDVVAIGWGEHSAGYALDLLDWGANVVLVTNGNTFEGDESAREVLDRHEIEIVEERVEELVADGDGMKAVRVASGRVIDAQRAFFSIEHKPRTALAQQLGCELDDMGYIEVGEHGETSVDGVYAAGDVTPGEQLVQAAAAEGAIAGIACAMSLRGEPSPAPVPDPGPDPEKELGE